MPLPQLKLVLTLIGVVYFLMPLDLIPDAAGLLGRIDDLFIIGYLIRFYWRRKFAQQEAKTGPEHERADEQVRTESNPYAILGINPGATLEEVTAAYKREAAKYHPDKVSHLGEELQKLAHERMLAIGEAYERLRQ